AHYGRATGGLLAGGACCSVAAGDTPLWSCHTGQADGPARLLILGFFAYPPSCLGQKTPYSFSLRVDGGEAGLDVLAPERHQAPAPHLEAAPMVLRIIADARQWLGRCHGPAGGTMRRRPLGRHAARARDRADVGAKAGAAPPPVMGARSPAL